ncbi:hypothetical protein TWF481_002882 [Arthrobotrys musiformis]|uniref:Uncharacterized protein n=1 Tax=Arthrobotrys musiformis TaxID=47236 RepID=A0AAV9VRI8_9PEZI
MSLDGPFDTIEAYHGLLDRLEKEGLVPGMDVPCWSALVPRDRLRMLPTYTKQQLPTTLPKDHPSVVKSYFAADDPIMHAISQTANNIDYWSSRYIHISIDRSIAMQWRYISMYWIDRQSTV